MRCPRLVELPPPPPGSTGWPWTVESPQLPDTMPEGGPWPRISIVTANYNQGQYLEETIRSVLLQGYPDIEYIVMDGGSTDDSVSTIRKYEKFITYWISQRDAGQADALNSGFAKANGDILAYINADDRYESYALSEIAKCWSSMAGANCSRLLLCGAVQDFYDDGSLGVLHQPPPLRDIIAFAEGRRYLHQPGCFWSRDLWRGSSGFATDLHYVFDNLFFTYLMMNTKVIQIVISNTLAGFRLHPQSKTSNYPDRFGSEWLIAMSRLAKMTTGPRGWRLRNWVWRVLNERKMWELLASPDVGDSSRRFAAHIKADPLSLTLRPVLGAARRIYQRRFLEAG
jgi:glycosyltransferase involved in cell wall biosynthesis